MLNLSSKADREKLEARIQDDIDTYCIEKYSDGPRTHLGASEMGEECSRKLFYKFRWMANENFEGRVLRLFRVGHDSEIRFVDYLRGIGFEVKEFAQELWYSEQLNDYKVLEFDADKSGGTGSYVPVVSTFHFEAAKKRSLEVKQWRVSGVMGHYGGSLDGMCKPPARYEIEDWIIFLNEFKTNGTGKGYSAVGDEDYLFKSKPKHWDQMCQYGFKRQLKYGLYLIENKNDSDITVKIVELDWKRGEELERKAQDIITAKEPPPKISENPSFFNCKFCLASHICHDGAIPLKNCRSCRMATPVDNAEWYCSNFNDIIPKDYIANGCPQWTPI